MLWTKHLDNGTGVWSASLLSVSQRFVPICVSADWHFDGILHSIRMSLRPWHVLTRPQGYCITPHGSALEKSFFSFLEEPSVAFIVKDLVVSCICSNNNINNNNNNNNNYNNNNHYYYYLNCHCHCDQHMIRIWLQTGWTKPLEINVTPTKEQKKVPKKQKNSHYTMRNRKPKYSKKKKLTKWAGHSWVYREQQIYHSNYLPEILSRHLDRLLIFLLLCGCVFRKVICHIVMFFFHVFFFWSFFFT